MTTLIIAALLVFNLASFATLAYALLHALDGFEDHIGFHRVIASQAGNA
jgi:hypothetical protein